MAYPAKLRERALQAVRNGHTKAEVSAMFGLGINTLKAWENLEAETGSLENRALNRTAYKIDREQLLQWYRKNPYSTNKEAAIAFDCSVSGIRSAKGFLGITRKKTPSNTADATSKSGRNSSLK
jgi:transposase